MGWMSWVTVGLAVSVGVAACSSSNSNEPGGAGNGGVSGQGASGGRGGVGGHNAADAGAGGVGTAAAGPVAGSDAGGAGNGGSAAGVGGAAGAKPEGGAPPQSDACAEAGAPVGDGTGATQAQLIGTWHLQDGGGEDIFLEVHADGTGEYAEDYSDAHSSSYVTWTGPIEVSETLITLDATSGTYSLDAGGHTTEETLPPQTLRFRYSYDAQTVTLYLSVPGCGDRSDSPSVGYLTGTVALKHDP